MADVEDRLELSSAENQVRKSAKRTRDVFAAEYVTPNTGSDPILQRSRLASRVRSEYDSVRQLPAFIQERQQKAVRARTGGRQSLVNGNREQSQDPTMKMIEGVTDRGAAEAEGNAVALRKRQGGLPGSGNTFTNGESRALSRRPAVQPVKPKWHAPWKLMRVLAGHLGWVRCLDVEPGNKWICSGAGDRTIKIWDLASGTLRLSLTGHISTVRGLAVSPRHPYLFSCGEDKMVKCWDLETNKVIRHYHGHLSGVYALSLHPTLDVLVTAGRDAVARVWDIRTKQNVHVLSGHKGTVTSVKCQEFDPQVITGSMDTHVRLWDLAAGKSMSVLTHHKKSVRALSLHPREFTFASGAADNIKQWKCPEGAFMQNFDNQQSIINTLSTNADDIMFAGGDNGTLSFFDWQSGHCYQNFQTKVQPGSLESEAGIFASTFDKTGLRLITAEADKSIKIYKQDEEATEESHPLEWTPNLSRSRF